MQSEHHMSQIKNSFIGREKETRKVLNHLTMRYPESIMLVGIRSIGKSSFLRYIREILKKPEMIKSMQTDRFEKFICVACDLTNVPHLEPGELYKLLIERILQELASLGLKISDSEGKTFGDLHQLLCDLTDSGYRCIFFLDEFDVVTSNSKFGHVFFDALRSLAGGDLSVAFITSSNNDLRSMCHSIQVKTSDFFNIFSHVQLSLLDSKSAKLMIASNLELEYDNEAIIPILNTTGRHPYLISVICDIIKRSYSQINEVKLSEIRVDFDEKVSQYYKFVWQDISNSEKHALMASSLGQLIDTSSPEVRELVNKGLLCMSSEYVVPFSDSFRDFIKSYREPDKLKRLTEIVYNGFGGDDSAVDSWLQQQTRDTARPMKGTAYQKLEEFLLENDKGKLDALEALGWPQLRSIVSSNIGKPSPTLSMSELRDLILKNLGFSVSRRPEGINSSIKKIDSYLDELRYAESHDQIWVLGMKGCRICEQNLRELWEFYASFVFGPSYYEAMNDLKLLPQKAGKNLKISEMTFGQRMDAILRLQAYVNRRGKQQFLVAFNRECKILNDDVLQRLTRIGKARGSRWAHESPEKDVMQEPLGLFREEVLDILREIRTILETWQKDRIYPEVIVYWGEWLDHHNLKIYHTETETGQPLKVRTSFPLEPGLFYYCYSLTNPIAMDPVLLLKRS